MSVNSDQTAPQKHFDYDLHCCLSTDTCYKHTQDVKWTCSNFRMSTVRVILPKYPNTVSPLYTCTGIRYNYKIHYNDN